MGRILVELGGGLGNQGYMLLAAQSLAESLGRKVTPVLALRYRQSAHNSSARDLNFIDDTKIERLSFPRRIRMIAMFRLSRLLGGKVIGINNRYVWVNSSELPKCSVPKGDLYLRGYFQTSKHALAWKAKKRVDLKHPSESIDEIRKICDEESVVALHVRRGDYSLHEDTHGTLPNSYYLNALATVISSVGRPSRIWVFSDDLEYCKATYPKLLGAQIQFPEEEWGLNAAESFLCLSLVDSLVAANSTFSLLAGTLSDAKVIVSPRPLFRNLPTDSTLVPQHFFTVDVEWER